MAFKPVNLDAHTTKFNSAASSTLLTLYENAATAEILDKESEVKHKTFAPSSFRCKRQNWFRLRGVQPDTIDVVDLSLDFTAKMGEACHRLIQSRLKTILGDGWITVEQHFKECPPDFEYTLKSDPSGFETFVEIKNPPVRFACDGILKIDGIKYLHEIKSSDHTSFMELTEPKSQHVDQIICYSSLLNLEHALVTYIDRQYGGMKCFEQSVSWSAQHNVREVMDDVQKHVEMNIAPEGLPVGDAWCGSNMCPYYKVCKEWGR